MTRSPVTRVQVDAYRFGLRRMESALARRDPVPMHEEIRSQRRSVAAGVTLAMLALAVTAGYAKVVPKPAWERQEIVVGKQSGSLYAVIHQPDRLVPVANLAAARLVLAVAAEASGSSASGGSGARAVPVVIDDARLDGAARTPTAAVPGAAALLPGADPADIRGPMPWALCDTAAGDTAAGDTAAGDTAAGATAAGDTAAPELWTTAVAGIPAPVTRPLGAEEGLLLRGPDGRAHLVAAGRRHRVDLRDPAVVTAYDLRRWQPRPASAGLLAAIPEGAPVTAPTIPSDGEAAPGALAAQIGDVLRVTRADEPDRYFVVLADGLQQVPEPVMELIRQSAPPGRFDLSEPPPRVRLDQVNALPGVSELNVAGYPQVRPEVLEAVDGRTVCWQWREGARDGTVAVGAVAPVPAGRSATVLAQADGAGARLDAVAVPTGAAVVVRGAVPGPLIPGSGSAPGMLRLVSGTGVGYPVSDQDSADALGLVTEAPAPEAVLRLLPAGPTLDLAAARRTVDVLIAATPG